MQSTKRLLGPMLALALCSVALGCAMTRLMMRSEGVEHEAYPSEIPLCQSQELPYFDIELSELIPTEIEQGERANHRLTYVMCPEKPTQSMPGTLTKQILHKGEPIELYRSEEPFDLEEGRWTIDHFIVFPPDTAPGAYALEVVFAYEGGEVRRVSSFIVEPK